MIGRGGSQYSKSKFFIILQIIRQRFIWLFHVYPTSWKANRAKGNKQMNVDWKIADIFRSKHTEKWTSNQVFSFHLHERSKHSIIQSLKPIKVSNKNEWLTLPARYHIVVPTRTISTCKDLRTVQKNIQHRPKQREEGKNDISFTSEQLKQKKGMYE